ncbi:hypothetical protein B0O99DRAFT_144823 [Bisporella sp. PMI_857]|nr:hypothetical protein B0O99DRAFT_144823 [Bisporella sp. PMI_857]
MATPVLLVLGAGPKIGLEVAKAFAAKGYKIALAARSFSDGVGEDGYLRLKVDLANTEEVPKTFTKVTEQLGIPSVVVYNGSDAVRLNPEDPLSTVPIESVKREFAVNTFSPVLAAQEAVKGFKKLPSSASRTFIFTGNFLNINVWPSMLTFGMSKNATAHLIRGASIAYQSQGFKFYYADQRQEDGGPTVPVGGPAAGVAYVRLAEDTEQGKSSFQKQEFQM